MYDVYNIVYVFLLNSVKEARYLHFDHALPLNTAVQVYSQRVTLLKLRIVHIWLLVIKI